MYGYGNSMFLVTHGILANSGTPPANTVAPAITGTAQEGQTVTCSTGTKTGTPTITYAYQWKRNGSNIGSATNSTYILVSADVSQSITCQVTATNGVGSANATSNTITPIAAVDPDAQAFITAASITNPTQQNAIIQLVTDLKGYSIWSKFIAIYPFVGGTSTSHKYNLKNPLDTDAAFRLSFLGGWTHSTTGALPNGTNGYADTFIFPNVSLGTNQILGYYLGTDNSGGIEMGSSGGTDTGLFTKLGTTFYLDFPSGYVDRTTFTNSNSKGNYLIYNNSTLGRGVYKNGSSVHSTAFVNKNIGDNNFRKLFLARNVYGNYGQKEFRLAFVATGFISTTEITNLQTAIQTFETTLGRNV